VPQPENLGHLELPLADQVQQGDPGGAGCAPNAPSCGEDDCNLFKQLTCAGVLATCGGGCVASSAAYVACVLPCLTAAGAVFCSDCL
jgi:hypothetical protein